MGLHMETSHSWPITETLKQIEAKLLLLEDLLPKTDVILDRDHNTADDLLLEIILANMRSTTKSFYIALQREKRNKKQELLKKLNEFSSYVHLNDFYKERQEAEGELRRLNEDFLSNSCFLFKNTSLLNDCKPTREFLTMEQRRAGYCNISKLKVAKWDKTTGKEINIEVTEPMEIRGEMRDFYQNIFAKQEVLEGPSAIE